MWRTPPLWVIVIRDMVCLVLGVWGVVAEELSGKAELGRLAFFGVLAFAPATLATMWLGPTGSPSSPPPAPESPPSPSSSSSAG